MRTPDIGTGQREEGERIDFTRLRQTRRARVFAAMEDAGLDACIFGREANARYASGVRRLWTAQTRPFVPSCILVRATAHTQLLSFSASTEGLPEELTADNIFAVTWNPSRYRDVLAHTPGLLDARRIGVDGMTVMFADMLHALVPRAELVSAEALMRGLRRRKYPDEIVCIKTAIAIAEAGLVASIAALRPGTSEKALQAAYFERQCLLGTSQFARGGTFTTMMPGLELREMTANYGIDDGSIVAMAGGALFAGYEGSLARSWWCGQNIRPQAAHRALAARGDDVMARLTEACKSGASGADIHAAFSRLQNEHRVARFAVSASGMGNEGFIAANAFDSALEAEQRIESGMVLSIRVTLRDDLCGGYLIEDMVQVLSDRAQRLTSLGYGPLADDR